MFVNYHKCDLQGNPLVKKEREAEETTGEGKTSDFADTPNQED